VFGETEYTSFLLSTLGLDKSTVGDSLSKLHILNRWLLENNLKLSDDSLDKFLIYARDHFSPGTVNNYIISFKRMYHFCKARGLTYLTRTDDYKQLRYSPGMVEILTTEEITRILGECHGTLYAFIKFLALTGCRIGEACSIEVRDILVDQKKIIFRETKTDQSRAGFLSDELLLLLQKECQGKKSDELVFCTSNIDTLQRTQHFRRQLISVCKNLGINKNIHPHIFRHSFATALLSKGVPIESVATLLGHQDIKTTFKFYSHFNDAELRRYAMRHPLVEESVSKAEKIKNLAEEIRHITSELKKGFRVALTEEKTKLLLRIDTV